MKRAGFLGITLSLLTSIFFVFATDFVSARQDFIPETKSLAGQWGQVTSPTSQVLMGISMLSSTVGWAVGNNGTIVSWNGKNWYTENSPTSEDLFAVDFLSPSDGWAVGAGGTILHWNGDKWSKKSSPVSFWLNDIHMLSSSNGWIVGHGGTLLHWNGSNWSRASADYMPQIESVDLVSSSSGWAVGADVYMEMLRWNGSSWNSVNLSNINSRLKSVDMLSSSYGWAGGENGVMLRWNGSSWSQVGIPTDASIETIDMLSSTNGWSAGQYGEILHWNGSSWSFAESPLSSGWLFDMEMLSSDEGWAVGMDGVILRYGDERNADLRQAGEIQISGDLVEGGKVYLTFPVKNYGDAPSPPIHPYTEGYTSKNKLWRADGAQPTAVILDPGETVIFQVEHDLWYEHVGEWTTYGVYLWNDANNGYYGPLSSNGYDQQISFTVKPIDVYIEDIDIHYYQVVMSEADWVPRVANKPTLIRVFPRVDGKERVPASVKVKLLNSSGDEVSAELKPYNPSAKEAFVNPDKDKADNSFNFIFNSSGDISKIEAEVSSFIDRVPGNNIATKNVFIQEPARSAVIGWIPFDYNGKTQTLNELTLSYFKEMYPGSINYKKIKNADSIKMNFPYIWSIYLNKIVSFWKETISHQANPPDRLYGLVPNEAYLSPDKVGEADVYWNGGSGRVAVGADIETMFAHELLHLLDQEGLHHAKWEYNNSKCEHKDESNYNKLMKDADYLNDTGNLDIVGFRLTAPGQEKLILKKTDNTYDVMTYCNPRWISEYNYKKLRLGFEDFSPSIDQLTNSSLSNQGDLMLISGIVYSDTMDVEFAPLFPLGPYAQADLDLVGDYCLEQRAADNTLLDSNCFDLTFYNYETGEIRNEDGFVRALQSYTDTKSIELTYLGGTIGEITASEHTPNVDLLSPNGGEIWGVDGSQSVQWQASDDDSDELHFALFFSPDDGISWSPVALELLGTQTDIDISVFEGSPAARLKVIASDGFHTSEDVSDNSFMVLQKSPEVIISNPTDETFLQHGYSAIFQGWASDIEDEAILNENLIWTSSLDGSLGSGEWIIAQNLSPGEHEITLFATDGDDNMSSSSITVFVGHRVFLPINTR